MIIQNNIKNKSNINFEALKFKKVNNTKLLETFPIRLGTDKKAVDCYIHTRANKDNTFNILLYSKQGNKVIGESFSEIDDKKVLNNETINRCFSNLKTLQNIKGIGSTLELCNIITMLENNLNKIQIYSLGEACCFHSKFKFKPNPTSKYLLQLSIKNNILNKRGNDDRFLNICTAGEKWTKGEFGKSNLKVGIQILNKYINKLNRLKLSTTPSYQIEDGIEMELTKESVIRNKTFFNLLFKKYGLDYQIKN